MPLAHGWKGLSLNVLLTLQDDSGGFEIILKLSSSII